ncbi:MAG TPA: hypothetical protein VLX44_09810, partial [Xanthobacteraceae bacterium]|nr:hypothetical protein [Xanthobacteraceae bacterium]
MANPGVFARAEPEPVSIRNAQLRRARQAAALSQIKDRMARPCMRALGAQRTSGGRTMGDIGILRNRWWIAIASGI